MALMMSLNESMCQSVPGAGILLGAAITALGSPRTALAVAGAGSLVVTGVAWFALTGLHMTGSPLPGHSGPATAAPVTNGDTSAQEIFEISHAAIRKHAQAMAVRTAHSSKPSAGGRRRSVETIS